MQKLRPLFFLMTLLFSFSNNTLRAQEKDNSTFAVKANGSQINLKAYIEAMEKANFNCYHLSKTRRTLTFDTGITVELFSVSEMLVNNIIVNRTCIVDETKLSKKQPVYHLSDLGMIIEMHDDVIYNQKHQSVN